MFTKNAVWKVYKFTQSVHKVLKNIFLMHTKMQHMTLAISMLINMFLLRTRTNRPILKTLPQS